MELFFNALVQCLDEPGAGGIHMFIGRELIHDESLSKLERLYIWLLGVPINGLRIRARRILPLIAKGYKHILDAGCGPGIFTFELARRLPGSRVVGIDVDSRLVEKNQRIVEKIKLRNCFFEMEDINTLSIEGRYDLIVCVDNLEHIEDDRKALKNFYRALQYGGDLLLHVPAYWRRWLFFRWPVNFDVDSHFRPGYTQEEIQEKIELAGFKIQKICYTYGWIETVTNNISYLITRARMQNKILYAVVFPFLNILSFFGRNSKPKKGAGILVVARKESSWKQQSFP